MTRKRIEDMREVVLPFVRKRLLETNYENLGKSDAEEFARDFNEILNLAIEALKEESKWIPVSEKLPEPFMYVNATCRSLIDDREDWVIETLYLPIPKEVNEHGYSDWGNIPMLNCGEAEVIAWVERIIPQPYKAESEEV